MAVAPTDEQAFQRLVEPHRRELHAHCYRMLGSVHDADDALQDALLRAWRGLARFEGRSSPRSWLYKIATNTCLDLAAKRPKRILPLDHVPEGDPHAGTGAPLAESVWIEPYPDTEARYEQRESLELAFIAALQHLPANQRAALILREVLGFSAQEAADALDTTTASVNSALQRARKSIDDRLPDASQQETLRALGDERLREIVERFVEAMEHADIEGVVSLLAEDAAWSMPPLTTWFRGHDALRVFMKFGPLSGAWRWRQQPLRVNGQAALACYVWDDARGGFRPFCLNVLTFRGDKIADVTSFIDRATDLPEEAYATYPVQPEGSGTLFERFGLPDR
jgi:RNA polymerase sigma-70 factor (ECF subfamily)